MGLLNLIPGYSQSPFGQFLGQNKNAISSIGAGMVGHGNDPRDILKGAVGGLQHGRSVDEEQAILAEEKAQQQAAIEQEQQQQNATIQWLQQQGYDDLVSAVGGGFDIGEAWKIGLERANPEMAGGDESFYGNVVPFQNQDGSLGFGQMGNRGTFRPLNLPDGASPAPTTRTVNTETEQIVMDLYGNVLDRIPVENREAAFETAVGSGLGKATADMASGAPAAIATANNTLQAIDGVLSDPNLNSVLGLNSMFPVVPGEARAGTIAKIEQLQGQAFLTAFATLKGAGAITEREGEAATKAIARLQRSQRPEDFRAAVMELRAIVEAAKQRAEGQMQSVGPSQMPPASGGGSRTTSTGISYSF